MDTTTNEMKTFLEEFRKEVQSPTSDENVHIKIVGNYSIDPEEVTGQVIDWVLYYLENRKCPYQLAVTVAKITAEQIVAYVSEGCKEANTDMERGKLLNSISLYAETIKKLPSICESFLDQIIDEETCCSSSYAVSVFAIRNKRRKMEDRHVIHHDLNTLLDLKNVPPHSYYAVFDGHCGVDAASYASAYLHVNIAKHPAFLTDTPTAIAEAFKVTDENFLKKCEENVRGGCTALCALIREKTLYMSWLGDSQAVLVKQGKPLTIVNPHKPDRQDERERIEKLGGHVSFTGTWRVNGILAVSRALGDPEYKPFVSSEPEISVIQLDGTEDFLILACDGLWDGMSPEDVTSALYHNLSENALNEPLDAVAAKLVHQSKLQGSEDNITAIVIFLRDIKDIIESTKLISDFTQSSTLSGNFSFMNGEKKLCNLSPTFTKPTVLELNAASAKKLKNTANVLSSAGIGSTSYSYQYSENSMEGASFQGINISSNDCAQNISIPFQNVASCYAPEATALSELPTPPIDDVLASQHFQELLSADLYQSLNSGVPQPCNSSVLDDSNADILKDESISSMQSYTDFSSMTQTSTCMTYSSETTETKVHRVVESYNENITTADHSITPDEAVDIASCLVSNTIETAVKQLSLSDACAAPLTVSSQKLNPYAEPFVMKSFIPNEGNDFQNETKGSKDDLFHPQTNTQILPAHESGSSFKSFESCSDNIINDPIKVIGNASCSNLIPEELSEASVVAENPKVNSELENKLNFESNAETSAVEDNLVGNFEISEASSKTSVLKSSSTAISESSEVCNESLCLNNSSTLKSGTSVVDFVSEEFSKNTYENVAEKEGSIGETSEKFATDYDFSSETSSDKIVSNISSNAESLLAEEMKMQTDSYAESISNPTYVPEAILENEVNLQNKLPGGIVNFQVSQASKIPASNDEPSSEVAPCISPLANKDFKNDLLEFSKVNDTIENSNSPVADKGFKRDLLEFSNVDDTIENSKYIADKVQSETSDLKVPVVGVANDPFSSICLQKDLVKSTEAALLPDQAAEDSHTESSAVEIQSGISPADCNVSSFKNDLLELSNVIDTIENSKYTIDKVECKIPDSSLPIVGIAKDPLSLICMQEELLKSTEAVLPSDQAADGSHIEAFAVDLQSVPANVPEAEGVTEDVDSDSEKDGGWSYMKGNIVNGTQPKSEESVAAKPAKLSDVKSSSKVKKEIVKSALDTKIKAKSTGPVDKSRKLPLERKVLEIKDRNKTTKPTSSSIVPKSNTDNAAKSTSTVSRTKRETTTSGTLSVNKVSSTAATTSTKVALSAPGKVSRLTVQRNPTSSGKSAVTLNTDQSPGSSVRNVNSTTAGVNVKSKSAVSASESRTAHLTKSSTLSKGQPSNQSNKTNAVSAARTTASLNRLTASLVPNKVSASKSVTLSKPVTELKTKQIQSTMKKTVISAVKKTDIKETKDIVNKQILARRNAPPSSANSNKAATLGSKSTVGSKLTVGSKSSVAKTHSAPVMNKKDVPKMPPKLSGRHAVPSKLSKDRSVDKDKKTGVKEASDQKKCDLVAVGEEERNVVLSKASDEEKEKYILEANDKETIVKEQNEISPDTDQGLCSLENGGLNENIKPVEDKLAATECTPESLL